MLEKKYKVLQAFRERPLLLNGNIQEKTMSQEIQVEQGANAKDIQ